MEEKTTRREERLVLEARLANYLENIESCPPGDRGYWEVKIQQVRSELARLSGENGDKK